MSETSTVRALLDLENSGSDIFFERVPGSSAYLWPFARWPIADALASTHLKVTAHTLLHPRTSRLYYLKRMIREALPNPWSSDRLRETAEHLFFVSGVTRTSAPRGVGNWLVDEFAEALGQRAAVVENAAFDLLTPRAARPSNPRTWTWAPASARIRDAADDQPPSDAAQEQVVDYLAEIFSQLGEFLPPESHDKITREVLGWVSRVHYADTEFSSLLDRVRPEYLHMEDASYGHLSSLIRIAHERGIKVTELQHGWIGPSHAAYNYGRAWFDSPLTSSLPSALLTFGSFWGEALRFPGEIIPVGKPQLESATKAASPHRQRGNRLLVVSSVYERSRLLAATKLIRSLLPESWEVVLRPHPSERADAETLFSSAISEGVRIDREPDVNRSIGSSRAVVGMVSTVLYEALPFNVHIGVIETDLAEYYTDAQTFPRRLDGEGSVEEFVRTITSGEIPDMENVRSIWHPQPVQSFMEACTPN